MSEVKIKKWVNKRTSKDKFSALHFASFKGNMKAIRILIAN